ACPVKQPKGLPDEDRGFTGELLPAFSFQLSASSRFELLSALPDPYRFSISDSNLTMPCTKAMKMATKYQVF
ncbi:MAG: hypothetical protein R6T98_09085, partial [Desulfatiglandales bacterium]